MKFIYDPEFAARAIANAAIGFRSNIRIEANGLAVDAKSIDKIESLKLNRGMNIIIRAYGSDAQEAVESIIDLINNGFDS